MADIHDSFNILQSFGKLETEYVEAQALHRFIRVSDDILKSSPYLIERLTQMGIKLGDVLLD